MAAEHNPGGNGPAERMSAQRRYTGQFLAAMMVYAVVLIGSILVIQRNPDAWWRFPLAITPVIPVVVGIMAVVRRMRSMDELEQRIQLEALAFGYGCTAVLTFGYGFLQGVGFPQLNWTYLLPLMAALWGIGLALASRRYR